MKGTAAADSNHRQVTLTVTLMSDWWNAHYFPDHPRPELATDDALERLFRERVRFLGRHFDKYKYGEPTPMDEGVGINVVSRWCVDFIPFLLGVPLRSAAEGFWLPQPLAADEIARLRPVDIAALPYGEWVLRRKDALVRRYGNARVGEAIEGSLNAAFRIRGEEIYSEMMDSPGLIRHLLDVITETLLLVHRFFAREFTLSHLFLANCTANHIGAERYEEFCLPNDRYLANATRDLFHRDTHVYLHHCDLPVDRFIQAYARIPYLYQLDGSFDSDIGRVKAEIPQAEFNAFVNPRHLRGHVPETTTVVIGSAIDRGADHFTVANLDARVEIRDINNLLQAFTHACEQRAIDPVVTIVPLAEEEYGWELPRYQGTGVYRHDDDIRVFIPAV